MTAKHLYVVAVPETWIRYHEVYATSPQEAAQIVNDTLPPGKEGNTKYCESKPMSEWEVVDTEIE